MLAEFWSSFAVTIAGVATTGGVAFAARFTWRWATAMMPTLALIELTTHGYKIINEGDFTIHVLAVEALGPPDNWRKDYERSRRVAPGKYTSAEFDAENGITMRVDRSYRVVLRDDRFARWEATYDPERRDGHTLRNPQLKRVWPRFVNPFRTASRRFSWLRWMSGGSHS